MEFADFLMSILVGVLTYWIIELTKAYSPETVAIYNSLYSSSTNASISNELF